MIHRLIRRGARKYGKARTLCGLDVEGQIHPDAEVFTDGELHGADEFHEPECQRCKAIYEGAIAESRARSGYRTVHFLDHGLPLCGYGEGKTPSEWPADQAWLALSEYMSYRPPRDVDVQICKGCKAKFEAWHAAHPQRCLTTKIVSPTREVRCELKAGHPQPCSYPVENALEHMREPKNPDDGMKRFEVWSLRTIGNGGVDLRVGEGIVNRDGSISVQLPALGVRLKLKPV